MVMIALVISAACAAPGPTSTPTAGPTATATLEPVGAWRLVAAADRASDWAYSVHAATTAAEWSDLWGRLSPGLDVPRVDFATEIATVFADGTGGPGNCSERRLDGVVIDVAAAVVYSEISDPLAPRSCDAMLGGSSIFVVAVQRAALPPSPFTLQLGRQPNCNGCPERITVNAH